MFLSGGKLNHDSGGRAVGLVRGDQSTVLLLPLSRCVSSLLLQHEMKNRAEPHANQAEANAFSKEIMFSCGSYLGKELVPFPSP